MVDGGIVGVLAVTDLLKGLQAKGQEARVVDWMQREIQSADIDESLESVMKRLQSTRCPLLAVNENDQFVGIVNSDNTMELISIQTSLQTGAAATANRTLQP